MPGQYLIDQSIVTHTELQSDSGCDWNNDLVTFPLSNFLTEETHIAISTESESVDAHKVAAQTENSKMDGDPMNAPVPLNLER
jgi:hypothetical protein